MLAVIALSLVGLAIAAPSTSTVGAGSMPYHDGTVVQNVRDTSPKKGGNVCVTKTIHNKSDTIAVFNLYTSKSWYKKADWQVVKTADGTPFVVQRKLGNNSVGSVGSSGSLAVNREYTTYALAPFGNNTSASLTACQDRQ